MKCKCNKIIPKARIELGNRTCVDCSDVQPYGCVQVTYHKTGNTIQITSQEVADKLRRLSARSGYGIMRGIKMN